MSKERYYIDTHGNDDLAYKEAVQYACKLANENSNIKRVVLLIKAKGNDGWFGRIFGDTAVKKLYDGTTVTGCDCSFQFETVRTYKDRASASEIVIACGLDAEEVLKIDDYYSVAAIIAIPWLENSLGKWINTWNPIDIRTGKSAVKTLSEPSCVVKKAMEELTGEINTTTGIHHPNDEHKAKTFILALHKYEPSIDANVVGAYLSRELGWDTDHAKEVEDLINTLNNGRHFQGGSRTGLQDYYKEWKKKCEG